jgi:hypothetical protein
MGKVRNTDKIVLKILKQCHNVGGADEYRKAELTWRLKVEWQRVKMAQEDHAQYWMLRYLKEWVISRQPRGQLCALRATTQHIMFLIVFFLAYFLSVHPLQQSFKIFLTYFLVNGPI